MLHKLVFDTTDADTIADSHSVGAYLRSADGTLITHTDVSGKKALDVRVAEGINVEVDLTFAEDSVDVSGSTVELGATTLAALESITVSATDLDIRNLVFATDKVDASGSVVALDAGTLAALENITVSASDLDIRDLAFATDSVDVSGSAVSITGDVNVTQGTSPWVVSGSVTTSDAALANTAVAHAKRSLAVADTAEDAVASPLANRKYLWLYNKDNREAYIGGAGVSAATGFPIPVGAMVEMRAGAAIALKWVSPKASHDLRTLELS